MIANVCLPCPVLIRLEIFWIPQVGTLLYVQFLFQCSDNLFIKKKVYGIIASYSSRQCIEKENTTIFSWFFNWIEFVLNNMFTINRSVVILQDVSRRPSIRLISESISNLSPKIYTPRVSDILNYMFNFMVTFNRKHYI